MAQGVLIRHSDGREYVVPAGAFEKGAETDYKGFRIVSNEDGSKYDGPKTAAAIAKSDDGAAPKASAKADSKGGE
jgi:hypothetical protein